MVVIVCRHLSSFAFAVTFKMASSSNRSHTFSLTAWGHMIQQCSGVMLEFGACVNWRFWALCAVSRPSPSCVLPGMFPELCVTGTICMHFILAWWTFRPHGFLHKKAFCTCHHVSITVCWCFWSIWMGSSPPPLSGIPENILPWVDL